RFQGGLQARLDRMRDEVIERDGDLEELFRSPRFRDPEVMSLVAAYHLAWVRYQGAQLVGDAAKKRGLLQKAGEGCSQFVLENAAPALARAPPPGPRPWPARVARLVAEKLGGGTPAGVHSTYGLFLLAQLAVDRGRCDDVPPFAEASEAVHDGTRARLRPEIL